MARSVTTIASGVRSCTADDSTCCECETELRVARRACAVAAAACSGHGVVEAGLDAESAGVGADEAALGGSEEG